MAVGYKNPYATPATYFIWWPTDIYKVQRKTIRIKISHVLSAPGEQKINVLLFFYNSCGYILSCKNYVDTLGARIFGIQILSASCKRTFLLDKIYPPLSNGLRLNLFGHQYPYPFLIVVLLSLFSVALYLTKAQNSCFQIPVVCFKWTNNILQLFAEHFS